MESHQIFVLFIASIHAHGFQTEYITPSKHVSSDNKQTKPQAADQNAPARTMLKHLQHVEPTNMQNPVSREKRQVCSCMACAERNSKNPLNIGKDIPYEAVCKVFKFLKIARKRIKVRYSRQGQLYCKNGYLIHIDKDGRISGTTSHKDQYSALEFQSLGAGKVIIKGVVTGRYLAINDQGLLYSTDTFNKEAIMEEKQEENFYHSFNSHRYRQPGWYVALRRNGQVKKTSVMQKAAQFLVLYK